MVYGVPQVMNDSAPKPNETLPPGSRIRGGGGKEVVLRPGAYGGPAYHARFSKQLENS